jgi:hypothetical protein
VMDLSTVEALKGRIQKQLRIAKIKTHQQDKSYREYFSLFRHPSTSQAIALLSWQSFVFGQVHPSIPTDSFRCQLLRLSYTRKK